MGEDPTMVMYGAMLVATTEYMTVVLKVGMSCQGCAGAVKRVLDKMEGVESFDIDLKEQKVTVKGNVQADAVFQTVSKTGKKTSFWEAEAPAEVPKEAPAEVTKEIPAEVPKEEAPAEVPKEEAPAEVPKEAPAEAEAKPTEVVAAP